LALPGLSSVTLYPGGGKPIPGLVDWHNFRLHFPKDAVLMRTITLGGRRLETQLLHFEGVDWRPYTFAWRDDQSDADLVPADGVALPPFDRTSAAREKKLADPGDVAQPLEARARAYLHANCGHCHSDHGGGSVPLRLHFSFSLADTKAIGVRPTRGDFGLPDG